MVLKKERPPFRARDDAHHHPGAYTFSSAKSAKTHVGDAVNHYTPHPRACACRCSLFRERESDFSPTNQPTTNQPLREKGTSPTTQTNNNALNLFSFSHHPKPALSKKKKKKRKRERRKLSRVVIDRSPGKAWVFRRFLIVRCSFVR